MQHQPTTSPEVVADAPLDPFADPAAPAPARTYQQPAVTAETAEQRARRCPHFKVCVCDHTDCREGWLDADEPDPIPSDPMHVRTRRCPRCNDAREMTTELSKGNRR